MAEYSLADLSRSGIYQIVNTINGKRYVGSAQVFRKRWNVHRAALNKGMHHSPHLQGAWSKHGPTAFAFEIIEFCDPSDLICREQMALDHLQPAYNVCRVAGSTLGRRHTPEARAKIASKASQRQFPAMTLEHRAALSAALVGKKKSAAHAEALQRGRLAHVASEDQRKRVSDSLKKSYAEGLRSRVKTEAHKQKIGMAYAKLTDEQVREIRRLKKDGSTCKALAEQFSSNAGTICEIANGKRYRWVI